MIRDIVLGVFSVAFLFLASPVSATVYINELSTYKSEDWVELYADSDTDVSGWILKDSTSTIATIDEGKVIGSSGFISINVKDRLNRPGDTVILYTKDESTKIDEFSYGIKDGPCAPTGEYQSVGRETDGSLSLVRFQLSTRDATNEGAPKEPCPTPSPTPVSTNTPIPTPTKSPTNTPTPQPTKSPTPSPTKSVTPTKSPTPTPTPTQETKLVLGETISITSTPTVVKTKSSTVAVGAKVFLILGLLFLGIAIITFTYKMQTLS
ncbi:hypothetical protein HYT02_04745 [Candidatus Gottesmanbacteria bacterium]|nr:hypothetical protein [Candidatus Gottesmanbacteria bacterium]